MANVVIYYQKDENESSKHAILCIEKLIKQLEYQHTIKGVFVERKNESIQLMDLISSPLSIIDYIYINKPIKNEFDRELMKQLLRTENFKLKYF